MSDLLTQIEDTTAKALQNIPTPPIEKIHDYVIKISAILNPGNNNDPGISESDINLITRRLQERFDISMPLGTLFAAEDYRPWLDETRGDIDWYYWSRYKRSLNYGPNVIQSLDNITDQILDHIENPQKSGSWQRKGMVVGHVQSGKTANYIGLTCKAADAGYKVVIILAGMLNTLRNQTQLRLDNGFLGINTLQKNPTGVGLVDYRRRPAYFTTNVEDFKKNIANQVGVGLATLNEPALLVIKKNKTTLENLSDWLDNNNPHNLQDHPMLLIDDEADLASINTKKESEEATAINQGIRQLIRRFSRSSYVGYTATPFANVFIDPETDDEMLGDDLFPRDFILNLDPPTNYVGPSKIFSDDNDLDIVRNIKDYQKLLPLNHKKDWRPEYLPNSLINAIRIFILCRAVRLVRGQKTSHNSMMINVSRFTGVQSHIHNLVDQYLRNVLRPSILNYYALNESDALKNSEISILYELWRSEYNDSGITWQQTQQQLKESVSPVSVIEVNSSKSSEPLDYSASNYPNGRNVIAVGGLNLSRGLTLEGLTVSYFLRNSIMYDTLMQMGRWFGYRDDYLDLCRIYMTADARSWYQYISDAMDELRSEFSRMKAAGMSPKDFGLGVRSHPQALIVTARNKMRTGKKILRQVNLEGRLVESSTLINIDSIITENRKQLERMVKEAKDYGKQSPAKPNYLWQDVPGEHVTNFIKYFHNHPASQLTEPNPLIEYIKWLGGNGRDKWDVVLVNLANEDGRKIISNIEGCSIVAQMRQVTEGPGNSIVLNKHRVASRGIEKIGLSDYEIQEAEKGYRNECQETRKKINVPDRVYRKTRKKPLLMLHILDCRINGQPINQDGIVAYGISFCGESGNRRPEKLVEYVVNTVWWNNNYQYALDEDDDEESDE